MHLSEQTENKRTSIDYLLHSCLGFYHKIVLILCPQNLYAMSLPEIEQKITINI